TTASEFSGFIRDQFTTLPEVRDRIFATSVSARWNYQGGWSQYNSTHSRVRALMLEVFASHHSLAVQQTMHAMGEEILAACPQIAEISFSIPNRHPIHFNLTPFGLE